jgi:hypothetical protein
MRIYKLMNFSPEISDNDLLLAKAINLLAEIEDRSTQETIDLLSSETQYSQVAS